MTIGGGKTTTSVISFRRYCVCIIYTVCVCVCVYYIYICLMYKRPLQCTYEHAKQINFILHSQNVATKGFQEREKALLWLTNVPLGPILNVAV